MNGTNLPNEMCVEVGDMKQCMNGEYLLAAIVIECGLYFLMFCFGVKLLDYIRQKMRGDRNAHLRQDQIRRK